MLYLFPKGLSLSKHNDHFSLIWSKKFKIYEIGFPMHETILQYFGFCHLQFQKKTFICIWNESSEKRGMIGSYGQIWTFLPLCCREWHHSFLLVLILIFSHYICFLNHLKLHPAIWKVSVSVTKYVKNTKTQGIFSVFLLSSYSQKTSKKLRYLVFIDLIDAPLILDPIFIERNDILFASKSKLNQSQNFFFDKNLTKL